MSSGTFSEAAVREEIISPILRALHYSSNGGNDVRYGLSLRYPRDVLGRKNPASDRRIRGVADYLCRAGRRVPWIIEAKPSEPITDDDVEQAYSYAKHPEIRASYFCLCNGIEFRVYATDADPTVGPLRTVDPTDAESAARELSSLLGAEPLLARFAQVAADSRSPIGPGLLSFAQILRGKIVYNRSAGDLPFMRGFTISITRGAIQLVDGSGLCAYWESQAPFDSIQKTIDRLGLTRVEAISSSTSLSTDARSPTVFLLNSTAIFPRGEKLWDLTRYEEQELLQDLRCHLTTQATGTLSGSRFGGLFEIHVDYEILQQERFAKVGEFSATGEFELWLK
jgi:hypothetical protein